MHCIRYLVAKKKKVGGHIDGTQAASLSTLLSRPDAVFGRPKKEAAMGDQTVDAYEHGSRNREHHHDERRSW